VAWEVRGNAHRYYYRTQRLADGRVKKSYVGPGSAGELAAAADQVKRAERDLAIQRHRDLIQLVARMTEPLTDLCRDCDVVTEAALLAAGYHRHRGEWRKRHGRHQTCTLQLFK
jgi:hypothetical protein